jgi:hypothetical protein
MIDDDDDYDYEAVSEVNNQQRNQRTQRKPVQ